MKKAPFILLLMFGLTVLIGFISKKTETIISEVCVRPEEQKLYTLIMEYRKRNNLPVIPMSQSLTYVAQLHCVDLYTNNPDLDEKCNSHSWSNKGKWTPCCYTSDHKQAELMWSKPRELTSYTGSGYEIAAGSSRPNYSKADITAEEALKLWQGSVHHNNVILNKDIWKDSEWNAIGIGVYKQYSVVWFGELSDEEGKPVLCK